MATTVVKFSGVYDNDSLPKLGVMKFNFVGSGSSRRVVVGGTDIIVKAFKNDGTQLPAADPLVCDVDGYIEVWNKYGIGWVALDQLPDSEVNIDDLKYSDDLIHIYLLKAVGNLSSFQGKTFTADNFWLVRSSFGHLQGRLFGFSITGKRVKIQSPEIEGDINFFANTASLTYLDLSGCANLEGSISSLGSLVNMTTLNIQNCQKITQDYEDMCDAMYANGRVSGTLTITPKNYNGSNAIVIDFSNSGWTKR